MPQTNDIKGLARDLERLERYARFLDSAIRLPGGFRIGFDSVVGLVPGIGDAFAGLLSTYLILEGRRLGAPRAVLLRMGANILLDTVIGSVPVLGDAFDIVFKANLRNIALLQRHIHDPTSTAQRSRGMLVVYSAALLTMLVVATALPVLAIVGLIHLLR